MKRERFLSLVRSHCRKAGREFREDRVAGKGSHIKVWVDSSEPIVKSGELSPRYMKLVLRQLGLPTDLV